MTKFIISAALNENKDLRLTDTPAQNQGEGNSSAIKLTVPERLAKGTNFYLEFLCPQNKRFVSPRLRKYSTPQKDALLCCNVPPCVLQNSGLVKIQLVATDASDNSVAYKSNLSNLASFFVRPSINAEAEQEHNKAQ